MILLKARKPAGIDAARARLRTELAGVFERQRRAIIRYMRTGKKDQGPPIPDGFPGFDDFNLGALAMSGRMTPLIRMIWDDAADSFAPRVGLDPDSWSVVNPHTERMIEEAALAFCEATNATTSQDLADATAKLRDELRAGIVDAGESLTELTKRVNAIFDQATTSRARTIAWTETARAVHAAQEQAAMASGVVAGWKWLLSGDACPLCVAIAARMPAARLGQAFAVIGSDPNYSEVRFPPAHPHCGCTLVEVLDTDPQPEWGATLHDPDPATDEERERIGADLAARDAAISAGGKRLRPRPIRRPTSLSRKRWSLAR